MAGAGWLWVLNNLLLVTLVEEALFRGYIQGGLSQHFKQLAYGENLALLLASLLFGLVHPGAGWQWMLLASLAGARLWPGLSLWRIGRSHSDALFA